jgi:hypothetical protein
VQKHKGATMKLPSFSFCIVGRLLNHWRTILSYGFTHGMVIF